MDSDGRGKSVEALKANLAAMVQAGSAWPDCEQAAVNLARAMLAAGAQEDQVVADLQRLGISEEGAGELIETIRPPQDSQDSEAATDQQGKPAEVETLSSWQAPDAAPDDSPVCPHCLEPVGQFDHFCPKCRGPVTAHASIDPMGQVYALGHGYGKAVSSRPRFIVVLGMWLIFAPQIPPLGYCFLYLVVSLCGSHSILGDFYPFSTVHDWFSQLLMLSFVGILLAIYIGFLWKVTNRYVVGNPPKEDEGGQPPAAG